MGRAVDDQEGYYLIGYNPDDASFKPDKSGPRYHKIQIKVKRPGLRVRSRKGFYGVASTGTEAAPSTEHASTSAESARNSPASHRSSPRARRS